jgi:TolA-binding protein
MPNRPAIALLLALLTGCAATGGAPGGSALGMQAGQESPAVERASTDEVEAALGQAMHQLDAGQFAQAGAAFEAFVAGNGGNPNVPLALYNGAIAWEKANQTEKASALREQLLAKFPRSKEAEHAMPTLAAQRARQGKKEEAIKLYREFLEKYPDSSLRCSATYNLGATLDEVRKPVDAAQAYLAFGSDSRCASADANAAARLLYRAGELLERAGMMPDAKKAYLACAEVAGVTDLVGKGQQAEARKRSRR